MSNEETGRLILQAHSGLHGNVAKKLADALVEQLAETDRLNAVIADLQGNREPTVDAPVVDAPVGGDSAVEPQSLEPQST